MHLPYNGGQNIPVYLPIMQVTISHTLVYLFDNTGQNSVAIQPRWWADLLQSAPSLPNPCHALMEGCGLARDTGQAPVI